MLIDMILAIGGGLYLTGLAAISLMLFSYRDPSSIAWLKVVAWPVVVGAAIVQRIKED